MILSDLLRGKQSTHLTLEHVNGVVRTTTNAVPFFLAPRLTNMKYINLLTKVHCMGY